MAGRLQGRIAIVTGGNSGIGEATARRFAREGAKVALLARREAEGRAVEASIRADGGEAAFFTCDVADRAAVEAAVGAVVTRYGGLHVLFNNAGSGARAAFPDESDETWQRVLAVNLTGTFLMCRAAWPHFLAAGGGAIVNMSSLAAASGMNAAAMAELPFMPSASYSVAKAGIEALTRYLAGAGGRHHIRVNCVRPGQIVNPQPGKPDKHVFKPFFDRMQILPGAGHPQDVADAVLFLASAEARYITGEVLNIDGGAAAKL